MALEWLPSRGGPEENLGLLLEFHFKVRDTTPFIPPQHSLRLPATPGCASGGADEGGRSHALSSSQVSSPDTHCHAAHFNRDLGVELEVSPASKSFAARAALRRLSMSAAFGLCRSRCGGLVRDSGMRLGVRLA